MKKRWLLHVAFWVVYMLEDTLLEYFWIRDSFPRLSEMERFLKALHANCGLLPVKLIFVYFIIFFAIDRGINRNKKIGLLLAEVTAMFLITIMLHRLAAIFYVNPYVYHEENGATRLFDGRRIFSAILDIGFVAGGAVAMKLLRMHLLGKEREKNLIREKLEAELKFLKTQTNPHFLFNTLNNIYALARKKSDDTADTVMKLSKLLRFMLYEARKSRISLLEEIHIIESYLELEKIRYNERLRIRFDKHIDDSSQEIAPMILLPFIENAFKHGAAETRFESFISIDLQLKNGILQFNIENSKDDNESNEVKENIGLSNVRRQLQLMYKEYDLQVQNLANTFKVSLTLNLQKNAAL
ncbi:MAG: sensor histidine kinase [Chitinophagaceae bacterium]|nr:sensor histidine kinase [Chitinophagaceae bacterium]